jgi:hypothetical protein
VGSHCRKEAETCLVLPLWETVLAHFALLECEIHGHMRDGQL